MKKYKDDTPAEREEANQRLFSALALTVYAALAVGALVIVYRLLTGR